MTKMKAKLFNDNIMRGDSISVDTFEGNVTLTGDKDMFQMLNMGSAAGCRT
jgi:osmotically-inducible protein OsmY